MALGASAGHWDLATIRHIADENRFNGIRCAEECFFSILAEGDGPWDVGDLDQIVSLVSLESLTR